MIDNLTSGYGSIGFITRNARWQLKLQEYNMLVTYKPGDKHLNADFFSRLKRHPSVQYMV